MASKVKKVTTSTGKTTLVKSGSKAEAKYKAQGATFSSDAGEVRAQKDVSKANTSSRSNADTMTVSENANDLFKAPTITSANTAPTTGINVPPPPPVGNLGTQTQTKMAGLGAAPQVDTTTTQTGATPQSTDFQTYLKSIVAPPSTADIYKKAEKEAGVQAKQQLVNQYQSQLNAINAKAQADILAQTGQGRGIPEAIIGGIQAQINKEAAIQSLPIAAQLSAAQDDLESAKDHLNTLFTIRSQDAQNKVNYQNKLVETVYNYANEQQKTALDEKRLKESRDFTILQNTLNYAQSLASTAISNGQPSLAARIMALDHNSPTYAQDVASAAKGIYVAPKSSGSGSSTDVSLTSEDRRTLIGSGLTSSEISLLESNINQFGIDRVLADITGDGAEAQKAAIRKVYGVGNNTKFLTKDFFSKTFSDAQLKTAAKEAGFRHLLTDWNTEKNNYLDHLTNIVEQYRTSGKSDEEILKLMQ